MKLIQAFIHHVRTAEVVQALADAGYRNFTLQDVKGSLKPLSESERSYSEGTGELVISEIQLTLVCEDDEVESVAALIRTAARIGPHISGWVYVIPIEQAQPIGGPGA